jgi:hypothetical protein
MGTHNVIGSLRQKKAWQYAVFAMAFGLLSIAFPAHSHAAAPQLYTSPSSVTTTTGSTFTVAVRVNQGSPVDAVEATLSYNTSFLRYVSVDATDSAFPIELPTRTTPTSVTITRGIFAPDVVNSDSLVAYVTFQVLNRSAVTTVKLTGNTTYAGAYLNPTTASTTVRIAKR